MLAWSLERYERLIVLGGDRARYADQRPDLFLSGRYGQTATGARLRPAPDCDR